MRRLISTFIALAGAFGCGTTQAQISDGMIKLGVLNDMSGLYSDIGGKGSVLAAQMAVDDVGNIPGARVEIVSADHQNRPDIGAGITRQWIDVDRVDAIVDVPTSSVALAVQDITRTKKRIFLMSGPATSDLTGKDCSPYGFQWTYDTLCAGPRNRPRNSETGRRHLVLHYSRLRIWPRA
jgi:branched-chain amino acid transport system substrate-binding protein